MGLLKRSWGRIRSTPPRTYFFALATLAVVLIFVSAGFWAWDYTNSSPFCGTTCHTMPPHYASYLASSHARVKCVECHIGRTSFGIEITRKTVDAQFVLAYLTGRYEYPIYVKNLQPARETCEKCHWPQKFSNDKIANIEHFATDEKNTADTVTLALKIGGGTAREGLGYGIHWHTENQIDYITTDNLQQNIPWIRVTDAQGNQTIYSDIQKPLTEDQINKAEKRRMDCIDCHNRTSHNFESPEVALDQALQIKQIDPTIPEIKRKGVELLTPLYKTGESNDIIAGLDAYYQKTYPDYYKANTQSVQNAVKSLQEMYGRLHYPDQGLDWKTHPNNIGHKDWPGCFRCHDGKHFTADNKKAIRLECNICHTIPVVSTQAEPQQVVSLSQPAEPASHKTTTWLAEHRLVFNSSCQQCHDTRNAGGSDNSSFCSNSACHGSKWTYAGLDAPELAKIFKPPVVPASRPDATPPDIPHPIGGNPDCQICHSIQSIVRPYPADHQGRSNDTCTACHKPTIPPTQASPAGGPPPVPHDLVGRAECLGCHNSGAASVPQIPQFHKDYEFPNSACLTCHKTGASATPAAPAVSPTTAATPTLEATPTPSATTAPGATNTPAATPTTAAAASPTAAAGAGVPALPADHVGRVACTGCHANGVGPALPADHAGRTDSQCTVCHKLP